MDVDKGSEATAL